LPILPVLALIATLADPPGGGNAPQADAAVATAPPQTDTDDDDIAPPTPDAPQPYQPPAVRPFEMSTGLPGAPVPYTVDENIPDAPVTVEAYRRSYEGPPDTVERAYQAGIKRNFDAQQVRMGPLDGAWTVRTQGGAGFMALMLADPGRADQEIEGAWRSLSSRGGQKRSGFLLSIGKEGQSLVLRWYPSDDTGNITVMRLNPTPDGHWSGDVRAGDVEFPVTMARTPQGF
jgi:hypothetical protein